MVIFGGFFQGITLPVIAAVSVYLRYRKTDSRLAPSLFSDLALWIALVTITVFAGYASWDRLIHQIVPGILGLFGVSQGG
jgi:hypothetical protein